MLPVKLVVLVVLVVVVDKHDQVTIVELHVLLASRVVQLLQLLLLVHTQKLLLAAIRSGRG